MKFEEFEAQLQEQLDRRQPLELTDEMRAAVAADPDCQRLFQAHAAWQAALAERARPEPSAKLSGRVLEALAQNGASDSTADEWEEQAQVWCEVVPDAELPSSGKTADIAAGSTAEPTPDARPMPLAQQVGPSRLRPWLIWTAAAASIAALTVVLVDRWNADDQPGGPGPGGLAVQPQPQPQPQPEVDRRSPDMRPQPRPEESAAFANVSQLAQEQYQALAAETQASWSELSVLVPEYSVEMVAAASPGEAQPADANVPATSNEGAAEGSSDQFQPFKESTRGAMGLLMRFTPR